MAERFPAFFGHPSVAGTLARAGIALLAAATLALALGTPVAADTVPTTMDPLTARREVDLANQLRCLVCQNQSIADSNAELARDLRTQIREQIAAGKSDGEIIDFMTSRYGDFVLYRPPFKATTLLLWLGPLLLLGAGGVVLARIARARRTRIAELGALSDEDRRRAEQLLAGDGDRS